MAWDLAATTICALVWGTSWYVITLQLGVVDPIISLVYRFSLAAAVLFLWCRGRGKPVGLSVEQHKAAAAVGLFSFTIDYGFTYLVLYFGIARRRGYTTASYILALTPLLAVTISTLFEGKKWNVPLNQRRASVTGSRIRWIRRTPPKRFA